MLSEEVLNNNIKTLVGLVDKDMVVKESDAIVLSSQLTKINLLSILFFVPNCEWEKIVLSIKPGNWRSDENTIKYIYSFLLAEVKGYVSKVGMISDGARTKIHKALGNVGIIAELPSNDAQLQGANNMLENVWEKLE